MKAARALLTEFRSGKGLKGQLLRGGVGSVAVKIGSTLLSVALAVILARALGAEGFGVYSFVFALITILAIPAQMGLPNLVVRETAKAQVANDWPLINGLWRWSTLMALMMSVALIAVGALAAWVFASHLPEGGLAVFYWGLVLVPLIALGNLRGAALRGLRHVVQGQLPEYILRPAFLIVLVLGAHFGLSARALTASDAMMLHALASLAVFMIGAFLLLRARPAEARTETRTTTHPRAWLAAAVPLGLISGMEVVNQNVGLITLGVFTSPEDVGLFRIALQGSLLVTFVLTAAKAIVAPHFAKLYAEADILRLQQLVTVNARLAFACALPVVAVLWLWGDFILYVVFGPEYIGAYLPLIILALAQLANAFTASVAVLLNMSGHERLTLMHTLASVSAGTVLAVVLAPLAGPIGAAIASTVALILRQILMWRSAYFHLGVESTVLGPKTMAIILRRKTFAGVGS